MAIFQTNGTVIMWSDDDKYLILYLRHMCLVIDRHLPLWIHIVRRIFPSAMFWRVASTLAAFSIGALIPVMYWFAVIVVVVIAVSVKDTLRHTPPGVLDRFEVLFDLPALSHIVADFERLLNNPPDEDTLDILHRSVYLWRYWAILSKEALYDETDACIDRGDDLDLRRRYNVLFR